ncbi:hypothetical protein CJ030_MR8G002223 [Morella rubra]|uniref:Uncharacterized protein n=1 Tax=Morella rubra TaxID=262757 RepID=A0A6A1UR43_9ROSI|nr:hypothetical protein CJ030_MR8G002223 [Morella rubra]
MPTSIHHFPSSLIFQILKHPKPSCPSFSLKSLTLTCTSQLSPNTRPKKTPTLNAPKYTSKKRRKPSYGTSRRSVLKKTFNQEQVMFTKPVSDDPVVAIIGGGMAGLICALNLAKRGVRSTVFDTGIHGLGGRMGTRIIDPYPLIFDHAAQFFTVSDSRFSELVDCWLEKGLVQEWQGTIGELDVGGQFAPLPSPPRYVGVNGMRPLADSLLSETCVVNVVRPCWISKLEPFNGMWHLSENGKPHGEFDAIVIAHNGKCANRLLATSGLPLIARQMKRLELSSIWALLAAFEDPLPIAGDAVTSFEGAFVKGVESVSWMANNTKKLLLSQSCGPHCWTFLSTAAYGKRNKVPQWSEGMMGLVLRALKASVGYEKGSRTHLQAGKIQASEAPSSHTGQENISNATADKVKAGMLEGVEAALGLSKGSLKPLYARVQLWGAALPTNTPSIPCIFDPHGRAGICGDWLLGSSLESAALSGMSLANHIADFFQSGEAHPEEFAIGLQNEFKPLEGCDIGQFPGLESTKQINEDRAYQLVS